MAINTKVIKGRINSVKNTRKITRAMEMIAAVKMRKSINLAVQTRAYSKLAQDMLGNLGGVKLQHALARVNKIKQENGEFSKPEKELIIVVSSNKGLCGGYNAKVNKAIDEYILQNNLDAKQIDVISIGSKSAYHAKKRSCNVVALYNALQESPKYEEIFPISRQIIQSFKKAEYKKVSIIFTNYISGLTQKVEHKEILPISKDTIKSFDKINNTNSTDENTVNKSIDLEFEPSKKQILNYVLPMLVEIQIYQSLLESIASEHASRMLAMKNASESASEMIDDLTLEFNKSRQAAITQEVAEIVSGANALGY